MMRIIFMGYCYPAPCVKKKLFHVLVIPYKYLSCLSARSFGPPSHMPTIERSLSLASSSSGIIFFLFNSERNFSMAFLIISATGALESFWSLSNASFCFSSRNIWNLTLAMLTSYTYHKGIICVCQFLWWDIYKFYTCGLCRRVFILAPITRLKSSAGQTCRCAIYAVDRCLFRDQFLPVFFGPPLHNCLWHFLEETVG